MCRRGEGGMCRRGGGGMCRENTVLLRVHRVIDSQGATGHGSTIPGRYTMRYTHRGKNINLYYTSLIIYIQVAPCPSPSPSSSSSSASKLLFGDIFKFGSPLLGPATVTPLDSVRSRLATPHDSVMSHLQSNPHDMSHLQSNPHDSISS